MIMLSGWRRRLHFADRGLELYERLRVLHSDGQRLGGGYEAAGFPHLAAALVYASRLACRPGIEGQIKDGIRRVWSKKE